MQKFFDENIESKELKDRKARHWCATFWKEPTFKPDDVRYMIIGKEVCPETQKLHWQTYIEFYKPVRMAAVKKMFLDNTVHLGVRFGLREQARDYCKKDNQFKELGNWISGQGFRTDLHDICEEMKNGKKITDIIEENPTVYCKYRNGLNDIAAHYSKQRVPAWRDVEVILLTGPTGCGKTREAMKEAKYKIEGFNLEWWQDYNEESCIVIDEYNNDISITKLLNLLDGYKLRLNVKGSHTYAHWTKVYITTNLKVDELHSNAKPAHRDALFRRITKVVNFW